MLQGPLRTYKYYSTYPTLRIQKNFKNWFLEEVLKRQVAHDFSDLQFDNNESNKI